MMTDKNLESAFPWDDPNTGNGASGMDLRDYFAAQALLPTISQITEVTSHGFRDALEDPAKYYAQMAYQIADAMMAEREKPNV